MKKVLVLLNILVFVVTINAQVGINTSTPSSNSVLELNSQFSNGNYGGFMPPRITEAQRNSIPVTTADDGLIAYVSFPNGDRCLQLYDAVGSTWVSIKCITTPVIPVTVFFEPVNSVTSSQLVTAYTGYSNTAPIAFTKPYYSTAASVNNNSPSDATISTASGTGNFYLQSGANRSFGITGIDLSSYTGTFTLSILVFKSTTTSTGSELVIEYNNGTSLVPLSITDLPTGAGTDNMWYERTLATNITNITELRFSVPSSNGTTFRIDDIKITNP
ncbi:hypothetical protein [Flavobacterium capsici]|uniref:CBM6 domain-containing protein n=1 Tax=Flavobacterium capsici TaxID=3075618 RepID=A0AA96F0U1_9FLAO|nr:MULTISPECIES: hypothetical protein [unclassified Flavobacterium]WNM20337.1 hypothetical protein RN608_06565 [Flavobacterium sp. PMR2A8]WNM21727.1 hypothetical protein RN605_13735 [Flavobacterium sp. PMTSA4]